MANDKSRRKELQEQYKQNRPEAGVYRITNTRNNRVFIGTALNLNSVKSKLAFGKSQNTTSVLDHRMIKDAREHGIDAFELEILEVLEIKPEATDADLRRELETLEQLYREQQDPALLY